MAYRKYGDEQVAIDAVELWTEFHCDCDIHDKVEGIWSEVRGTLEREENNR
jgi:hypothetical protein